MIEDPPSEHSPELPQTAAPELSVSASALGASGIEVPVDQPASESTVVHPDINSDQSREPREKPDTVIGDIHKAETMAYAEGDFRTKAVANRDVEREPKELTEKWSSLQDVTAQLDNPNGQLSRKERRRLTRQQEALKDEVTSDATADIDRRRGAETATRSQFQEDFPEHFLSTPENRAWFYDEQASRIGEWAGLLHDHPLSIEFKEARPGIQFQPKALVRMEDDAARMERRIEQYDSQHSSKIADDVMDVIEARGRHSAVYTPSEDPIKEIERMLTFANEATVERWQEITRKIENAAAEADEFYRGILEEVRVKPLRNQLAMTRNLLNDVRQEVGLPISKNDSNTTPAGVPGENPQRKPLIGSSGTPGELVFFRVNPDDPKSRVSRKASKSFV
jgi:hypothetical protein